MLVYVKGNFDIFHLDPIFGSFWVQGTNAEKYFWSEPSSEQSAAAVCFDVRPLTELASAAGSLMLNSNTMEGIPT
jgi:hypothetical protein